MSQQQVKVNLYSAILAFAVADVVFGIASFFIEAFPIQISALAITTITLVLSVVFAIKFPRNKRSDIAMIVVGGLDFVTTLISVLVIVMATQLIAIIASGATLFKAIKVFIQSEKARRLLGSAKPIVIKIARRIAPLVGAWCVKKIKKIKGDNNMEKVKEFFKKLGQNIWANKVSLGGTLVNGGICGFLGYLVNIVDTVVLEVGGVNFLPYFSILLFILVELCFHWEKFGDFMARISPKIEAKLKKRKEEEEEKQRQKLLNEMYAEKAAEKKAELEKEKAEAAAKAEAEAKAKKEQEDKELAEWLAKKQAQ